MICSKDADFRHLVAARGDRPRQLLLALGNAGCDEVLAALRAAAGRVYAAFAEATVGVAVIE